MNPDKTSRIPGLYRKPVAERLRLVGEARGLSDEAKTFLRAGGGLEASTADGMSENVIATHGLPLSVAPNFLVNGQDVLVPMAVEEPSVVAAASNAARLLRPGGGFKGRADEPVMTAQIQLDGVQRAVDAAERVEACRGRLLDAGDAAIPTMVARGGGCRDLELRVLDPSSGLVVLHVYVDVRDAMGANVVDTVAEAIAPLLQSVLGGTVGLCILSNLPLRRLVEVEARFRPEDEASRALAGGIARASRFAELDPFRAVTHNKGVLNGLDAAAVALGQDWRSIEAGAHAFASLSGRYQPLATWLWEDDELIGRIEMPLGVGTVGGSTRAHRGVRAAFEILGVDSSQDLAIVLAAVGLASNFAALRALAGEGIQQGHMRLHARKDSRALHGNEVSA